MAKENDELRRQAQSWQLKEHLVMEGLAAAERLICREKEFNGMQIQQPRDRDRDTLDQASQTEDSLCLDKLDWRFLMVSGRQRRARLAAVWDILCCLRNASIALSDSLSGHTLAHPPASSYTLAYPLASSPPSSSLLAHPSASVSPTRSHSSDAVHTAERGGHAELYHPSPSPCHDNIATQQPLHPTHTSPYHKNFPIQLHRDHHEPSCFAWDDRKYWAYRERDFQPGNHQEDSERDPLPGLEVPEPPSCLQVSKK